MNPWHERFRQKTYVYGTKPNQFIQDFAQIFPKQISLAAYAEGEGRNAVYLAKLGHQVTAYDYAPSGLEKTKALANSNSTTVNTKLVNLIDEPLLEDHYDGAVMVFGHFPKEHQLNILEKIMDSIKKQGIFMLEVYEEAQLAYNTGGPKMMELLYKDESLLKWAKKFEIKHFFSGEVVRNEGELHNGKCYVVQLIIKK